MSRHFYVFRSHWLVPAPVPIVFDALAKLDEYPHWWRQVRSTRAIDEQTCEIEVRSSLPYSLFMTAHHSRRDPEAGVLEARLTGDLEGHSRWTLAPSPDGTGTSLHFGEEVEVRRRLLRTLSFARPAFRVNHAVMMRAGERGLRRHLKAG
ncbi:SRPBCC family protein [Sporichthya sp.]|uniref:SRPBCC family protein n=1 Tax=Sporichthya sp. TaxID=65475 RepID=UPI001844FA17|nr:SRPBCC family protein [Sporichthya sp.]MBA3743023.1 polyketide cyclase [Sporichthya sp.]